MLFVLRSWTTFLLSIFVDRLMLLKFLLIGFLLLACLQECPAGTYKNVTGSDKSLCHICPVHELPHRAVYTSVRGRLYNLMDG